MCSSVLSQPTDFYRFHLERTAAAALLGRQKIYLNNIMYLSIGIPALPVYFDRKAFVAVGLVCWLANSFLGGKQVLPSWLTLFAIYAIYEFSFYIIEWMRYRNVNASTNTAPDKTRMKVAMARFTELRDILDIDEFLQGWFCGNKASDIRKGNMIEFIAYGFYCKKMEALTEEEHEQIEEFLVNTAKCWNISFKEGYDPQVRFMGHTLEPVKAFHKPLVFHLIFEVLALVSHLILYAWGFQKIQPENSKSAIKWVRHGSKKKDGTLETPVVFLHGVGFGVLPYLHFIHAIIRKSMTDRIIILVEMPHVALRLCPEAPDLSDLADDICKCVKEWSPTACFIGHSYGTFVVSKILHKYPSMVEKVVLLDPVSLMTCHPTLLKNFVYRSFGGFPSSVQHLMEFVQFLCSRDLTLTQTFCRKFNGMEAQIWPQDLPDETLIVLSGKDHLIPSELVKQQFSQSRTSIKVLCNELHPHGGFLFDMKSMNVVVDHVLRLLSHQR